MKRSIYFFLLLLLPALCHSQAIYKTLRIGDRSIVLEFPAKHIVEEQVWDSIIYMPDSLQFELMPHYIRTAYYNGKPIQAYSKQVYMEENGMVWQQVIKQKRKRDTKGVHYPYPLLVNDSAVDVATPYYRVDTVMQINPISLEEEMVVVKNNILRVAYDLGIISKQTIKRSITDKFGGQVNISGIYFNIIGDTYYGYAAYYNKAKRLRYVKQHPWDYPGEEDQYRNAETIESLCAKIDALPSGSKIIFGIEMIHSQPRYYYSNHASQLVTFTLTD
jgi:hypothetical protein